MLTVFGRLNNRIDSDISKIIEIVLNRVQFTMKDQFRSFFPCGGSVMGIKYFKQPLEAGAGFTGSP